MNKQLVTIKLSDVVFDEGLYPRVKGHDPEVVQNYARDMEQIEEAGAFISINADKVLIDGKHRYLAYKKINDGSLDVEIKAYQYAIVSQLETFKLACRIQDIGKSLSSEDKIESAKRMYAMGESSQAEIAKELHVGRTTVVGWLSRTLKEEKERKRETAFNLWLSCHTQEEIAEAVEVDQKTITNWEVDFRKKSEIDNFLNSPDFDPPIYNVWKQQSKSNNVDHFFTRHVRCYGVHVLYMSGGCPDSSEAMKWDNHDINKQSLLDLLRFDLDPDAPSRKMDTRRHHVVRRNTLGGLRFEGAA